MKIKEKDVKNILTKSNLPIAGYTVNPYIGCTHACKYCYAVFMKRFTGHKEKWGEFLDVKYWQPIKKPEKYNKTVMIGSVTDGYNQYEKEYKRTRAFLKEMLDSQINLIITTKSSLVERDIDLIKKYNNPLVSWSINTLDEKFRKDMDLASPIKDRIKAMKKFHKEGIRTACFISPIFPEITNVFDIINEVKEYADYIWLENLNLRAGYKETILNYIDNIYPNLYGLYEEIYLHKDNTYWKELDKKVKKFSKENDFMYVIDEEPFYNNPTKKPIIINYFYHNKIKQSSKKKNKN